jgi:catechol 2,3-dioxygenase
MSSLIKRMAHVGLHVPNLEASVDWATTVMGLREVERQDGISYLTHGDCHHSLQLYESDRSALDHVAIEAYDEEALTIVRERLVARGEHLISESPEERGIEQALRFRGPEGHVFEVFVGMAESAPTHTGKGVQPRKFGHPTLTCLDVHPTRLLFEDVFDFRLSDEIGDGVLAFLRCSPEHHGLGLQKGQPGLNHYAWQVESLAQLGDLGEALARNGGRFIWGPGRHGAGNNLFTYHYDPAGSVVEYYADMYTVWDERSYEPGHWSLDDHRAQNLWGPITPQDLMDAATLLGEPISAIAQP